MANTSDPSANDESSAHFEKPQKQHAWLQQLLGEWVSEGGMSDESEGRYSGSEVVKPLGELWIIGEGTSDMPDGGRFDMRLTLGFDPKRDRFIGTWIGSTMTFLWIYEGELDAAGKKLTLNSKGPSFANPQALANYQDIIEIVGPDERTLTSRLQGEDGKWTEFMKVTYRRKKGA